VQPQVCVVVLQAPEPLQFAFVKHMTHVPVSVAQ
jgi:hypothetical protein